MGREKGVAVPGYSHELNRPWWCIWCRVEQRGNPAIYQVYLCPRCVSETAENPRRVHHHECRAYQLENELKHLRRRHERLQERYECAMLARCDADSQAVPTVAQLREIAELSSVLMCWTPELSPLNRAGTITMNRLLNALEAAGYDTD